MTAIAAHTLTQIAGYLDQADVIGDANPTISAIVDDSRAATEGALYAVVLGDGADGSAYIEGARTRGAVALLLESAAQARFPSGLAAIIVPDVRRALARIAARVHGDPAQSMRIVGITGTNGKTTTSFMVAALLCDAGLAPLRIGTLGAAWGEYALTLGYTTPPPLELQALFARAVADGIRSAVMEVSSHALALERVAEVPIEIGVFTNLTRDHLDFHRSFEAYAEAKRKLFSISRAKIFNIEDPMGAAWCRDTGGIGYAIDRDADIVARDLRLDAGGSAFTVEGIAFALPMPGRFNVLNALAAIAVGRCFDISLTQMQMTLARFRGVPGRMERFVADDCTVVVDYSHTPDALERVLTTLRESAPSQLCVVFGCGGDRDPGKRPQMGAIAEAIADRVIVTSDNPRGEDPQTIADQVLAGMHNPGECILDRRTAIERAITEAPAKAIVLVAGKGAETEQRIGSDKLPFDDRHEAERALALRKRRNMET